MDISINPNGAYCAVEGLLSPDGRVFGKMGHSERYTDGLLRNVPGERISSLPRRVWNISSNKLLGEAEPLRMQGLFAFKWHGSTDAGKA